MDSQKRIISTKKRSSNLQRRISRSEYSSSNVKSVVVLNTLILVDPMKPQSQNLNPSMRPGKNGFIMQPFMDRKNYLKLNIETKTLENIKDLILLIRNHLKVTEGWENVSVNKIIDTSTNQIRNILEFVNCSLPIACSSLPKPKVLKFLQSISHLIPPQVVILPILKSSDDDKSISPSETQSSLEDIFDRLKISPNSSVDGDEMKNYGSGNEQKFSWKSSYSIICPIGEGSYSKIFHCQKHGDPSMEYALKLVSCDASNQRIICMHSEYKILQECKLKKEYYEKINLSNSSFSLPIILGYEFNTDKELGSGFLMEYAPYGDLLKFISKNGFLSEKSATIVLFQTLHAFNFLHNDLNIIHRDVKCENMLVINHTNEFICVKLGDFGLASTISEGTSLTEICGTPYYMAPEMLMQIGYSYPVDIWALAVMIFCILFGRQPFSNVPAITKSSNKNLHSNFDTGSDEIESVFEKIMNIDVQMSEAETESISSEMADFLMDIFNSTETDRKTAKMLLQEKWILKQVGSQCNI